MSTAGVLNFKMRGVFIISICFLSFSLIGQDINDGLLMHLAFSGNYEDSSLNGFTATNQGTVFSEDRFGDSNSAIFFNGVSDYVELPNNNVLRPDFPFSISSWIHIENFDLADPDALAIINTNLVLDNYHGAWMAVLKDRRIIAGYGDGSGCTGPGCRRSIATVSKDVQSDVWHHIVAIFKSPTEIILYLDGCIQEATTGGFGELEIAYDENVSGVLGRHDNNSFPGFALNPFHGAMDDIYFWDREITESDVNILYGEDNEISFEIDVDWDQYCQDNIFSLNIDLLNQHRVSDIIWTDTLGNVLGTDFSLSAEELGAYKVVVTDNCGRTFSLVIIVTAPEETTSLQWPNAFAPQIEIIEGEPSEFNRFFGPYSACNNEIEDFELIVYNQWGNLVFETQSLTEFWDGTKNGIDSPSDTYVWFSAYTINGERKKTNGTVNLIR